jgi:hypothetical protein
VLDVLEIPAGGQAPQKGDVIVMQMPGDKGDVSIEGLGLVPLVVLERELLWSPRFDKSDYDKPLKWSKMMIHVRRLSDYRLPASAAAE